MTPQQIELVVDSFAMVLRQRQDAGLIFYRRLFSIAPELQLLFKGNIELQARKLVETLAAAIASLNDMPALSAGLHALGARHGTYGVRRYDYLLVGRALLGTLRCVLGDAFDEATRQAWIALYREVSAAMIAGAGYEERTHVA